MNVDQFIRNKAKLINKAIEKYIPRAFTKDAAILRMNPPQYGYNLDALNQAIANPIWEFLDRGGKRWRPALFLLICEALGKNPIGVVDLAIIPEVIHNGTLMVDDIEDSSLLRRGKPCTYRIYGPDIAINAGNSMYYLPLLPLIEVEQRIPIQKRYKICEIYIQEMINLSLGQAMDIAWHKGLADADKIDEKDYLQMCAYKTGTLARMSARMAAVLADANDELVERLGRFAESIGIAFQMQDDVLDLTSKEFEEKKGGRGQDITEGKRSLVVIHTLNVAQTQDKERLLSILNMHSSDRRLIDEAIEILEKYDSITYVEQLAKKIVEQSWKDVENSIPTPDGKQKLRTFAEFLIKRKI